MAISEVNAACDLLGKANKLVTHIQDGYYKGSAEVDAFPAKVMTLKAKQAQWIDLLQRFGMTEDEHLRPLVAAATEILDKEEARVQKMRSRCVRYKKRVFPGKLIYILNSLLESVDAGPQLIANRVQANHLLEMSQAQRPAPLPFGPDRKYVPLLRSIREVRQALEDADGPPVVTIHGGPGWGKSSFVKYLALHYQEQKQEISVVSPTPVCFPGGVFYLLCGRGASGRIKELQLDLLESLGGIADPLAQLNSPAGALEKEGEVVHLPSHQMKLRFRLAEQKALIILDDVWEVEVLKELRVPGRRVKYLVTSQIRTICSDATMIELKSPNIEEARKILANYTEGLPIKGEFPATIQSVTDAVIEKLEYHPLSIANVGTIVNRRSATDPGEWEAVKDGLQDHLDKNDFHTSQLVYGTTYPLTLGASMALMVDSLDPDARHLLFLMELLTSSDHETPEVLVKVFLKQIQPSGTGWKNRYRRDIKYLKDRSLVEYRCHSAYDHVADEAHTSRPVLITHGLRSYYIRKKHEENMTGIATEIFSGGSRSSNDHGGQLVQSGCTDEALATIMGATFFEEPFRGAAATKLESQSRIFNGGVPRSMNYDVDALDLMDRTEELECAFRSLVWLLNPDGEGGWKQQAHEYAKRLVIRLTFRWELDDESMAGLIQLPHTTTAACRALTYIMQWYLGDALEDEFVDQNITFSSAYGQTMKSLNDMCSGLHDNVADKNRYVATFEVLGHVLLYDSDDIILSIAKKWVECLAKDSSPTLQTAVASAIHGMTLSKVTILVGEFPGVLDHLLMLIVEGRNSNVRQTAVKAIYALCGSRTMASKIAAIPNALEILFKKFLLGNVHEGKALCRLSCIPENRVKFIAVHGGLAGLTKMLTSNPKSQRLEVDFSLTAAKILANLATINEVRKTILAKFPEVREGLRLLQLSYFSRNYGPRDSMFEIETISRAMTILDPFQASSKITNNPVPFPRACYQEYMGRVRAHLQMQMYLEALEALNMAHEYYTQMPSENKSRCKMTELSLFRVFFKVMLEDYAGAMLDMNSAAGNDQKNYGQVSSAVLGERGVLKLLARVDLREALADLDEALKYRWDEKRRYGGLKHRGLVKFMMGDKVGAKADAEAALKLKFRWLVLEITDDALGPKRLIELPVSYLGFSL